MFASSHDSSVPPLVRDEHDAILATWDNPISQRKRDDKGIVSGNNGQTRADGRCDAEDDRQKLLADSVLISRFDHES